MHAPPSCYMLSMMMCTHVTCANWSLSNWNSPCCFQDKNGPRPFSPEKFALPVLGSELTGRGETAACLLCKGGSVPRAQYPGPACPSPLPLASLCCAWQGQTQVPTEARQGKELADWPSPGSMLSAEHFLGGAVPWGKGSFPWERQCSVTLSTRPLGGWEDPGVTGRGDSFDPSTWAVWPQTSHLDSLVTLPSHEELQF